MNKKIIWSIVVVVIVVILGLMYKGSSRPVVNNPIKIGAVISLSGFASPWGEYAKNGMDLAVNTINSSGGINGRPVVLVIEDDHTDGKTGVSAYNKLIAIDHVQGVIGGVFDFTAQPLMPLAVNNKLTFISPSNFRIAGGFDLNDQSFVMLTDFNKVIKQLKTYIDGEKITKLAVVHFKSTFGNEIAKTLDGVMKENGQSGIVNEEYTKIGDNNFRTTIAKLKSAGVQAVFLDMVGNDPLNFLNQSKQLGFKPTFISYNGITDAFAGEKDKSLLEGVVVLNWEITSPVFADMYQKAYNIPATKSADKYFDAVFVLAKSIAASSSTASVASYIEKNTFTTPNATISFTLDHAVQNTPVEIQVVKGGVLVSWGK